MSAPSRQATIQWIREQQTGLWRYLRLLGARADECEDLMQDAFVALFGKYPDHDPTAQVRLLRTIARNRFLEARRRDTHDVQSWTDTVDAWLARHPDALRDERSTQLAACLQELAPRARLGLQLRHVDDLPIDEVSKRLGLRRSGTLTLLQRSRDLLRACMARRSQAVRPTTSSSTRSEQRILS